MSARATVSVAVVGLGVMGERHLRTLQQRDDVEVVAVADHHRRQLAAPWYVDVEGLLAVHRPELMVVSVPARQHFAVVSAAVSAGIACLVDKPMVVDLVEAAELTGSSSAFVAVAHTERWNAAWIALRDAVRVAGSPVRSLRAHRTGPRPATTDVGPALDLAVHDADLADDLLGGELLPIGGSVDAASVDLRFRTPGSVAVHLRAGWDDVARRTVEVETDDAVWVGDLLRGAVTVTSRDLGSTPAVVPVAIEAAPLDRMYDDVLTALRSGDRPTVGCDEGARSVRAVLAGTLAGTG